MIIKINLIQMDNIFFLIQISSFILQDANSSQVNTVPEISSCDYLSKRVYKALT